MFLLSLAFAAGPPDPSAPQLDPLVDLLDLLDDPTSVADGASRRQREASALVTVLTGDELERLALPARAALPVAPAVQVLVRMLSYDRALPSRAGAEVRVTIVFDAHDPLSVEQSRDAQATLRGLGGVAIGGLVLVGEPTMVPSGTGAAARLAGHGVAILCRGADGVEDLAVAADQANLLLMSLDDGLMGHGPAVGVVQREARLEILVDIGAARLQGVDLSSEIFEIAHVVGTTGG